jgi:hypothetical protein
VQKENTLRLKRSATDPQLYQSWLQENTKDVIHFNFPENRIPAPCNVNLLKDYLEAIKSLKKEFNFYLFENTLVVSCPGLVGQAQLDPLVSVKHYIQAGEQLANTNKVSLLIKGSLLATIAVSSLIVILLSVFVPSLAILFPVAIPPLLMIAFCFSVIFFCSMSLPGYAEIKANKRELQLCEENLRTTLYQIHQASFRFGLGSDPHEALNQPATESQMLNEVVDPRDLPPSTSGRGFFVPTTVSRSLSALDDAPLPNAVSYSSLSLSAE